MAVGAIPPGFEGPTPSLAFHGAAEAIAWYQRAFGATEVMRLAMPDGAIAHAEIKIGGGIVMLADEMPPYNKTPKTLGGTTVNFNLYVADVDAAYAKAVDAGAKPVIPVSDQFYGDRCGRVEDPFGYVWILSTRKEDLSAAQMQQRFDEWLKQQGSQSRRAVMYLVQILLPLYDNDGRAIDSALFQETRRELVEKWGGLTAHSQSPVEGLWKDDPSHTTRDELVIFEVQCDELDRDWWRSYRETLEQRFRQEEIMLRAHQIQRL